MTSSSLAKTPCASCGKLSGLFKCRGCEKDFCKKHVLEHQQELSQQFDDLTVDHDLFRQDLLERTHSHHHPLIKQVEQWEQQSIERIHQIANQAREQIQDLIEERTHRLTEALSTIAQELRQAREDDDFHENDLKQWIDRLNQLKRDLAGPCDIDIRLENNQIVPLTLHAEKFVSTERTFGQSIGSIQIGDNGQVVIKDQPSRDATVRGTCQYTTGQHRLRFQMEEYNTGKWLFMGIISSDVPIRSSSYNSRSIYGWAGVNEVFLNGVCQVGFNGYKGDIEKNDIVELFIDCDQRMIRLRNERTRSTFELKIDTVNCPFPWELNFNLYYPGDCVRILQS